MNKKKIINSYKILCTSLDNAIDKKLIEIPDYIKIDVDVIEHLILIGFSKFLSNQKTKSILLEINKGWRLYTSPSPRNGILCRIRSAARKKKQRKEEERRVCEGKEKEDKEETQGRKERKTKRRVSEDKR